MSKTRASCFITGSKHLETDESTRPAASCFHLWCCVRWGSSRHKFGLTTLDDNVNWPPYRDISVRPPIYNYVDKPNFCMLYCLFGSVILPRRTSRGIFRYMNIGLGDIRFIRKSQSTSPKYHYIGARENEGTEREAPGQALGICHVHESYF